MSKDFLSQAPFRCRLDWGYSGALRAADRGDMVVLVDTLSFSTTVAYAVSRGAYIIPCGKSDNPEALADKHGAHLAVGRSEVPAIGTYSLSPLTFHHIGSGEKVVIPSLNGATCARLSAVADRLYAGALVNASAVSNELASHLESESACITIIACGEREPEPHEGLRMAIEDYLGAGAIIAELACSKSPEARLCEIAFASAGNLLKELVWESTSGRELRGCGFAADVEFSSRLNCLKSVPRLVDGLFLDQASRFRDRR